MCGIIACVGTDHTVDRLLTGLENLEYRGYDSAGIATQNGSGLKVLKKAGKISDLRETMESQVTGGKVGIGHTRWSTHGKPTDENAHPHTCEAGDIAAVHNGIIENYQELRHELEAAGHEFTSQTDTEVIPHLVAENLADGDVESAFRAAVDRLEGSYAVAVMVDGEETVYATREDSPLVLGVRDEEYYLASDIPAFLEFTDEVTYLEDGDVAIVTPEVVTITDRNGEEVLRSTERVDWDPEETGKGEYDHYMLKEIEHQPEALGNTISGRVQDGEVSLDAFPTGAFEGVSSVQLVGCGTSYHAAMYGAQLLNRAGVPANAYLASEYTGSVPVSDDTLVVAVTQSGETADTLNALREAERAGARTIAVTNVVGSTAAREVDQALFIRAGPEIGVAATKTFTSQVVTLALLAERIAIDVDSDGRATSEAFLEALEDLPDHFDETLARSRAESLARRRRDRDAYFFIGSDLARPVALEGALKFKEITYEHAEGFAAGELKHGPLALVTDDSVVFALFTGDESDERTRSNAMEARARGADVVAVAPDGIDISDVTTEVLRYPRTDPVLNGLLTNVQLQLVSYHVADLLDREIDQPRNLAKSVTVK